VLVSVLNEICGALVNGKICEVDKLVHEGLRIVCVLLSSKPDKSIVINIHLKGVKASY